jgi:hypothetical protein
MKSKTLQRLYRVASEYNQGLFPKILLQFLTISETFA